MLGYKKIGFARRSESMNTSTHATDRKNKQGNMISTKVKGKWMAKVRKKASSGGSKDKNEQMKNALFSNEKSSVFLHIN